MTESKTVINEPDGGVITAEWEGNITEAMLPRLNEELSQILGDVEKKARANLAANGSVVSGALSKALAVKIAVKRVRGSTYLRAFVGIDMDADKRRKKGEGKGWHVPKIYAKKVEFGSGDKEKFSKPFLRPALEGINRKISMAFENAARD